MRSILKERSSTRSRYPIARPQHEIPESAITTVASSEYSVSSVSSSRRRDKMAFLKYGEEASSSSKRRGVRRTDSMINRSREHARQIASALSNDPPSQDSFNSVTGAAAVGGGGKKSQSKIAAFADFQSAFNNNQNKNNSSMNSSTVWDDSQSDTSSFFDQDPFAQQAAVAAAKKQQQQQQQPKQSAAAIRRTRSRERQNGHRDRSPSLQSQSFVDDSNASSFVADWSSVTEPEHETTQQQFTKNTRARQSTLPSNSSMQASNYNAGGTETNGGGGEDNIVHIKQQHDGSYHRQTASPSSSQHSAEVVQRPLANLGGSAAARRRQRTQMRSNSADRSVRSNSADRSNVSVVSDSASSTQSPASPNRPYRRSESLPETIRKSNTSSSRHNVQPMMKDTARQFSAGGSSTSSVHNNNNATTSSVRSVGSRSATSSHAHSSNASHNHSNNNVDLFDHSSNANAGFSFDAFGLDATQMNAQLNQAMHDLSASHPEIIMMNGPLVNTNDDFAANNNKWNEQTSPTPSRSSTPPASGANDDFVDGFRVTTTSSHVSHNPKSRGASGNITQQQQQHSPSGTSTEKSSITSENSSQADNRSGGSSSNNQNAMNIFKEKAGMLRSRDNGPLRNSNSNNSLPRPRIVRPNTATSTSMQPNTVTSARSRGALGPPQPQHRRQQQQQQQDNIQFVDVDSDFASSTAAPTFPERTSAVVSGRANRPSSESGGRAFSDFRPPSDAGAFSNFGDFGGGNRATASGTRNRIGNVAAASEDGVGGGTGPASDVGVNSDFVGSNVPSDVGVDSDVGVSGTKMPGHQGGGNRVDDAIPLQVFSKDKKKHSRHNNMVVTTSPSITHNYEEKKEEWNGPPTPLTRGNLDALQSQFAQEQHATEEQGDETAQRQELPPNRLNSNKSPRNRDIPTAAQSEGGAALGTARPATINAAMEGLRSTPRSNGGDQQAQSDVGGGGSTPDFFKVKLRRTPVAAEEPSPSSQGHDSNQENLPEDQAFFGTTSNSNNNNNSPKPQPHSLEESLSFSKQNRNKTYKERQELELQQQQQQQPQIQQKQQQNPRHGDREEEEPRHETQVEAPQHEIQQQPAEQDVAARIQEQIAANRKYAAEQRQQQKDQQQQQQQDMFSSPASDQPIHRREQWQEPHGPQQDLSSSRLHLPQPHHRLCEAETQQTASIEDEPQHEEPQLDPRAAMMSMLKARGAALVDPDPAVETASAKEKELPPAIEVPTPSMEVVQINNSMPSRNSLSEDPQHLRSSTPKATKMMLNAFLAGRESVGEGGPGSPKKKPKKPGRPASPEVAVAPSRPALKDDPEFERYFKMLKLGMPMEVVKHAMARDGVDPSIMDGDHNKPVMLGVPLKEDPEYEKYFRMLKIGMPMDAVKHAMLRDGLDCSVMDQDHNLPVQSKTTEKTDVPQEEKDSHRRARLHWKTLRKVTSNSLWARLDEDIALDNIEIDEHEFQELFQAEKGQESAQKKTAVSIVPTSRSTSVRVIDGKRANNGGIILARLKMSHDEMADAVDRINENALSSEQIENIIEYLPSKEERKALETYMLEGGQDAAEKFEGLCECEKFMVSMMTVKHAKRKVRALLFKLQFEQCLDDILQDTLSVETACDELFNSVRLRQLLGIILTFGNRLNTAGNKKRKAGAFTLDSLLKLNQAKAFDKKTTFLHYVILIVQRNNEILLRFKDDLPAVFKADKVFWDQCLSDLDEVESQLENVRRIALYQARISNGYRLRRPKPDGDGDESLSDGEISLSLEEEVEALRATPIGVFTLSAIKYVSSLRDKVEETRSKYTTLLEYFGEEESTLQPHELFSTIAKFCRDFDKAKEEVFANEKKKMREERKRQAAKPPTHNTPDRRQHQQQQHDNTKMLRASNMQPSISAVMRPQQQQKTPPLLAYRQPQVSLHESNRRLERDQTHLPDGMPQYPEINEQQLGNQMPVPHGMAPCQDINNQRMGKPPSDQFEHRYQEEMRRLNGGPNNPQPPVPLHDSHRSEPNGSVTPQNQHPISPPEGQQEIESPYRPQYQEIPEDQPPHGYQKVQSPGRPRSKSPHHRPARPLSPRTPTQPYSNIPSPPTYRPAKPTLEDDSQDHHPTSSAQLPQTPERGPGIGQISIKPVLNPHSPNPHSDVALNPPHEPYNSQTLRKAQQAPQLPPETVPDTSKPQSEVQSESAELVSSRIQLAPSLEDPAHGASAANRSNGNMGMSLRQKARMRSRLHQQQQQRAPPVHSASAPPDFNKDALSAIAPKENKPSEPETQQAERPSLHERSQSSDSAKSDARSSFRYKRRMEVRNRLRQERASQNN